jgi:energy-coupling factor transport system ATP-binding protein
VLTPHGNVSGEIYFDGKLLSETDHRTQSSQIGYVMQNPDSQVVTDKVWHELAFGLESLGYDQKTIRLRVAEMASYFGIQGWFHKNVADLSGGQKQLLNLASIMAMQPSVLILDEPTSGLDPVVRDEIVEILNDFTRDESHSILISSHIVSDLEKICDYIAFIHNGKLMLCEEKDRLLEQFCFINTTEDMLRELDKSAIIGKKANKFGIEAIVDREKIPHSFNTQPVTIEELFIFMVKEAK